MISINNPQPTWIASSNQLDALTRRLMKESRVAIDTESNSLHAFREQVCLIQFSIPGEDFLVDPFSVKDFSPLNALFLDQSIEKIFHAAEYDLICLKRDFNLEINNIFDTMQAARILSYPAVGLNNMLQEKFQIVLDKRFQKADWARRPLPVDQLNYACMDTRYLLGLRDILYQELTDKCLWGLAFEEFQRISCCNGSSHQEVISWQRSKGATRLNPQQLAVLNELYKWRLGQAERMNRPVFKVVVDKLLIAVAESLPNHLDGLIEIGCTTRQIQLFGKDILSAVKRGLKAPPVTRLAVKRPSQAFLQRLEALRSWRKQVAQETGLESDVILPRSFMHSIAESNPNSLNSLANHMPHSPWRLEKYGFQILECIKLEKT